MRIRESAATRCAFCEPFLKTAPELGEGIAASRRPDAQVRLQVACTLGDWDDPRAGDAIGRIALADQQEPYIFAAAMSSVTKKNLGRVAAAVSRSGIPAHVAGPALSRPAHDGDRLSQRRRPDRLSRIDGAARVGTLSGLAALCGCRHARRPRPAENVPLRCSGDRLGEGRPRRWHNLRRWPPTPARRPPIVSLRRRPRLAAVQILGRSGTAADNQDIAVLGDLLSPQTPAVLQEGVVSALGKLRRGKVADVLLARWRSVGPAVRFEHSRRAYQPGRLDGRPARPC